VYDLCAKIPYNAGDIAYSWLGEFV